MDDPLSALDAHVKKKIFEKVFKTYLSGKTRVLVTHALDCLPYVDRIIVMKDGAIVYSGDYNNLRDTEYFETIAHGVDPSHHE